MQLKILFSLSICVFLISCEKDDSGTIDPILLTGAWRLHHVEIDHPAGSAINDLIAGTSILNLKNNETYYRNYVSGDWQVTGHTLTLDPVTELGIDPWSYTIIEVTPEKLRVRIFLTEGAYHGNFPEVEEDEILDITEEYIRE